jgi:hypothetical protein
MQAVGRGHSAAIGVCVGYISSTASIKNTFVVIRHLWSWRVVHMDCFKT